MSLRPKLLVLVGALLAIVLAAACNRGAPQSGPVAVQPTVPPVSVKTAPVEKQDIQQTLSYTGDIQSGNQIQVVPKVSGRIEKLLVDVGSTVHTGDTIAQFDTDTSQASFDQSQAAVASAEAALAAAQAKLASMKSGAKPEDIAGLQANVDLAQARLDQSSSPARSEAIASSQAALNQLQARLAGTAAGSKPEDVQAAQSAVDQAKSQVDQAGALADQAEKNAEGTAATVLGLQQQIKAQEQQVNSAQAALQEAKDAQQRAANGQGGEGIRPEDIQAAQSQTDAAWNQWQKLLHTPTQEDLDIAEASVKTAQDQVKVAKEQYDAAKDCSGAGCPDEDVAKAQVKVAEDQLAQAKANQAKVEAGPTQEERTAAEAAFKAAEANRNKIQSGGNMDAEAYALNVTAKQAALDAAKGSLGQLQSQLELAKSGELSSQASLAAQNAGKSVAVAGQAVAQAKLASAQNPNQFDVAAAQAAVDQAQAQLAQLVNPDPWAIKTAQAQLEQAQAQLASGMRPYKDEDIQAQQATVDQASAAVDQARAAVQVAQVNLEEAVIKAPISGVVSERNQSEGALVGQTTPIVTLVPPEMELDVAVEESNLSQVQSGDPVQVHVAAYPDQAFQGTVTTVSPTVDPKSRTVDVKIGLQDQQNLLKPGMFAQVGIVTEQLQDVLTVPKAAVVDRGSNPAVFVVQDGKAVRTPIKLGVADANSYQVLEGLSEGQQVVIQGQSELQNGDSVVALAPTS